jgi:23S rRNA pseudouridine2604 synthase
MNRAAPTPEEPQRLAKLVAILMSCSRREAEQYVTEGWVSVDGQKVDLPQFRVNAGQRVEVDPKARLLPVVPATLLVHKPAGIETEAVRATLGTATRWAGDNSGTAWMKGHGFGLTALFALPPQASGLAVFSQDARIVRRLREDAAFIEQELLAEVAGTLAEGGLQKLSHGLVQDGRPLPPAHVSWQSEKRLRIAAKGIAPEQVGWMCAQVGLQLTALRRIRLGRVAMAGLPSGEWRYLRAGERF